jgi:hypothetical protein
LEEEMTEAPALPFLEQVGSTRTAAGSARASRSRGSGFDGVEAVEIVAPDLYSAALLLVYAVPSFLGEIVPGSAWIVRFEPSTPAGDWVVELLSLVERWLKSVPLPCAKALHDDRRYLIRASTQGAQILDLPIAEALPDMSGPRSPCAFQEAMGERPFQARRDPNPSALLARHLRGTQ